MLYILGFFVGAKFIAYALSKGTLPQPNVKDLYIDLYPSDEARLLLQRDAVSWIAIPLKDKVQIYRINGISFMPDKSIRVFIPSHPFTLADNMAYTKTLA